MEMLGDGSECELRVRVLESQVRTLKATSLAVMVLASALLSIGWKSSTSAVDLVVATIALKVPAEEGDGGLRAAQGGLSMGLAADGTASIDVFDVFGSERTSVSAKADGEGDYHGAMAVLEDENATRIQIGFTHGPCATEMVVDEKREMWMRIGQYSEREEPELVVKRRAGVDLSGKGERFLGGPPTKARGTGTGSVLLGRLSNGDPVDVHGLLICDESDREILSTAAAVGRQSVMLDLDLSAIRPYLSAGVAVGRQSVPWLRLRRGISRVGFVTGVGVNGDGALLRMEGSDKEARASIVVTRWNDVNFRIHNQGHPPYVYGLPLNGPTLRDFWDALKSDLRLGR